MRTFPSSQRGILVALVAIMHGALALCDPLALARGHGQVMRVGLMLVGLGRVAWWVQDWWQQRPPGRGDARSSMQDRRRA